MHPAGGCTPITNSTIRLIQNRLYANHPTSFSYFSIYLRYGCGLDSDPCPLNSGVAPTLLGGDLQLSELTMGYMDQPAQINVLGIGFMTSVHQTMAVMSWHQTTIMWVYMCM